jgi:ubiquinone/menaquinone biosynthesis C-methylase UbiE
VANVGIYDDQILPRVTDLMLGRKALGKLRSRAMQGLSGTVVELGFGSGTNVPWYPDEVDRVLAVDPAEVGQKLSAKRRAHSPIRVEFVGLDGQALPLDDNSVDNALSTWTLCTIPDAAAALREVRRVLKPGGQLFFLEHGLADDPKVASRQHKWNGLQNRLAGGCNLDRDIGQLVSESGLVVDELANFWIPGPKPLAWMYAGRATKV